MTTIEQLTRPAARTCPHHPRCPAANAIDHAAARGISSHQEQGWNLLCNGVITFDDTGELLPDGTSGLSGQRCVRSGGFSRWLCRAGPRR